MNESRRDSWETRPSGLETDPTVAGRAMRWRPRLWVCARAREGAEGAGTRRDETRSTRNIGGRGDGGGRQTAQTHSVVAGLRERSQTTPASPAPCWHTTFAATLLSVAARTRQRRPVPTARRIPHRHSGSQAGPQHSGIAHTRLLLSLAQHSPRSGARCPRAQATAGFQNKRARRSCPTPASCSSLAEPTQAHARPRAPSHAPASASGSPNARVEGVHPTRSRPPPPLSPPMDQVAAKRILQELIKNEPLGNKRCIDCNNPNPQWASLRSAPSDHPA